LIAALLFYSSPMLGVLSCKAAVELALAFFQFASIYMIAIALEERHWGDWALSGLFAGMALGTKYTAWPAIGTLAAILVGKLVLVDGLRASARYIAALVVPMVIVSIVWPARNWFLYGNPIFPFLQQWFNSDGIHANLGKFASACGWQGWSSLFSVGGIRALFLRTWNASISPDDVMNIGPLLVLGLPLLIFFRYRKGPHRICFAATLLLWGYWDILTWTGRYLFPTLALFSVLYALAITEGFESSKKIAVSLFFCCVAVLNLLMTTSWFGIYGAMNVVWGSERTDVYLSEQHPSYPAPSYPAVKYIREHLPYDARVLFLADARGYGTGRDYVAPTEFDESPVSRYLREGADAGQLRERLKKDGFTHILVNQAEITARPTIWFQFTVREAAVWHEFSTRYLRTLFEQGDRTRVEETAVWCGVFEII